jgi:hypothetical protein
LHFKPRWPIEAVALRLAIDTFEDGFTARVNSGRAGG